MDETEKPQSSDSNEDSARMGPQRDESAGIPLGENQKKERGSKWKIWKKFEEGQKSDWWFASTGIPLLAATLGPLANISSIAALVTPWRQTVYLNGEFVPDFDGKPFGDPRWCYWLNVASLICGVLGNFFLLLNFTQRIRYLIALPATIIFWYLSTGFLAAITACMQIYEPPTHPVEGYTQGYWYAIAAAAMYLICSMILMINMLGYFMGHYPDTFALTDSQRTLILQTMAFFVWMGGGAAIFSKIEEDAGAQGWGFVDALYFCDVTILTVGFGDLYPTTNVGRGIVFPYSVGGIITLALIVSSLYKFMRELGQEKIVHKHIEKMRERALERTVTNSFDLRHREHEVGHLIRRRSLHALKISGPTNPRAYRTAMGNTVRRVTQNKPVARALGIKQKPPPLLLLREEKDRFEAMRQIQRETKKFKKWWALGFSITAFAVLWFIGALVFYEAEKNAQGMTYFEALYFCYISLLTIGYGDLAPKSNPGRCFFVIWSLIAVPTMTILVSDLGDTVVAKFKKWSDQLADFTVLPKHGIWRAFLDKHPWLLNWIQRRVQNRQAKKRLKKGFDTMDPNVENGQLDLPSADNDPEEAEDVIAATEPTIPTLAQEAEQDARGQKPNYASLSRRLAMCISKVAADLHHPTPRRYSYEEWVEFTRLIRLTTPSRLNREWGDGIDMEEEENEEGLVDWDWIGENSPMVSGLSESQWLLERLCESLVRLERRKEAACRRDDLDAMKAVEGKEIEEDGEMLASGANGGKDDKESMPG